MSPAEMNGDLESALMSIGVTRSQIELFVEKPCFDSRAGSTRTARFLQLISHVQHAVLK